MRRRGKGSAAGKRGLDVISSLMGMVVLLPIILCISLWIKLDSRGPVFFRQERVGKGGKPFRIYKFRTMIVDAERYGKQITVGHDSRITKSGRWLRKYKLDELPQLFNVLFGHMSLVGPRPEVPYYVSLYNEEQRKVLSVRPGITDAASIKYRNENDVLAAATEPERVYVEQIMPDKLRLNMEYIHQSSVLEDIRIIMLTIRRIITKEKIHVRGQENEYSAH